MLQEYQLQVANVSDFTGFTMAPPALFTQQNGDETVNVSFSTLAATVVYYTLDNSTPTTSSSAYDSTPVVLSAPTIVSYAAFTGGVQVSPTATALVGPVPSAPTALLATPGADGSSIDLNWVNTSTIATELLVQQNIDGSWVTIDTLAAGTTSTNVPGLSSIGSYDFRITAGGQSGLSAPATTSTASPGQQTPRYGVIDLGSNLRPQKITNTGFVLMFDSNGNPYRWTDGTSSALTVPSGDSLSAVTDISDKGTVIGYGSDGDDNEVLFEWPSGVNIATATVEDFSTPLLIDGNDNIWFTRIGDFPITGHYTAYTLVDPSPYTATINSGIGYQDGFYNNAEVGNPSASANPAIENEALWEHSGPGSPRLTGWLSGATIMPLLLSESGTAVCIQTSFTGTTTLTEDDYVEVPWGPIHPDVILHSNDPVTSYVFCNGAATGATLPFEPTAMSNAGSIIANGLYWDPSMTGTATLPDGFYPISVNAAVTDTGTAAYQIVGTDWWGTLQLLEKDPQTGNFPSTPVNVDAFLMPGSPWSNLIQYSIGNMNCITDNGAIIAIANYTPTGNSDSTPAGQHAVMLIPLQITKVWSDQNGDVASGDLSNNNFFTPTDTSGTGCGTIRDGPNQFLTMGFRADGDGHVKASIDVSALLSGLKGRILVQLAYGNSQSGPLTPFGQVATYFNGKIDPNTNIATLTGHTTLAMGFYDTVVDSDWRVVVGYDVNNDGILEPSEICCVSKYAIRAVDGESYDSAVTVLSGAYTYGVFFGRPLASEFVSTFISNVTPSGAKTPPANANITPSAHTPLVPQNVQVNVGALFDSNGNGSVQNYEFVQSSSETHEVENSQDFKTYITGFLAAHQHDVDAYFQTNPTASSYTFDWSPSANAPFDFTTLSFENSGDDLIDALHNVGVKLTLLKVTVDSGKNITELQTQGSIIDLYEFYWPDSQEDGLGIPVIYSGMEAQAGYPSQGFSGHVFESQFDLNIDDLSSNVNSTSNPNSTQVLNYQFQ